MTSRASSAIGEMIEAKKVVTMPEGKAVATSHTSDVIKHQGLFTNIRMSAKMIAKLVSTFIIDARILTNIKTDLIAHLSATIDGICNFAVALLSKIDACPAADVEAKNGFNPNMKAIPNPSSSEQIEAEFKTVEKIFAKVSASEAKSAITDLEVTHTIAAELEPSVSTTLGDIPFSIDTGLKSRLITWVFPEWVDEKTLYIRQVYETEWDGNVLVLK